MSYEDAYSDGQLGVYSVNPQGQPFPLEADVSRLVYGGRDNNLTVQPTSDISNSNTFSPRFNQLFTRGDDGQFYPVDPALVQYNPAQVQIPSYDMNPGLPCITQPGIGNDRLTAANLQRMQLRPEDLARIVLASQGNYMQNGLQPSRWNDSQFSMYQPGRVPPSQVPGYNIARLLLDPNSCIDNRGMCPSDYPQMRSQRSGRSCPQQQWTSFQQGYNPNYPQGFNSNFAQINLGNLGNIRFNPNLLSNQRFNPSLARQLNQSYAQGFNPNYPQNFNPTQNFNPNYPQNFNPNYPQNFNPNYPQNFNPNYPQAFNPNYPQDYDPNYPQDFNPNYPQDYMPTCNQNRYQNFNQNFNPRSAFMMGGHNNNMSQLLRFAPLALSLLNHGRGGFPGGFGGGGFNQFNQFGGYNRGGFNNFGGYNNFNGYGGGRGVNLRLGPLNFRL